MPARNCRSHKSLLTTPRILVSSSECWDQHSGDETSTRSAICLPVPWLRRGRRNNLSVTYTAVPTRVRSRSNGGRNAHHTCAMRSSSRRKFTPFVRSRQRSSTRSARLIWNLASRTMNLPRDIPGEKRDLQQFLSFSSTDCSRLRRHSGRLASFDIGGESPQRRPDLRLPCTRLFTEAVERRKRLSAYQLDGDLVKVAIEDGVHKTLGNRGRTVNDRLGRHPFEHLREVVSALGYCCGQTSVTTGGCPEKIFQRNLFSDASQ